MRLTTKKYKDGSTLSSEWDTIMDGPWPYPNNCEEVIYIMNMKDPAYE